MTARSAHRLQPLDPEAWDPALGHVRRLIGQPLNIHRVIARHPELMESYAPLREHIVTSSSLDAGDRELVILRVAHRTACDYEWRHHVVRGRKAGLDDDRIARVREGSEAAGWAGHESILLRAVDDMLDASEIGPETLNAMDGVFSDRQILDIVFTVGVYFVMSTLLKTACVPLEEDFEDDTILATGAR
ncbi:MAG: carboxymuconolactone decarboxylase family protein [Alphaproteobacteria bacterium]|nr:carboxymuconolactone decarboxylase family protein [Alphaproteobacteria bacterium]